MTSCYPTPAAMVHVTPTAMSETASSLSTVTAPTRAGPPVTTAGYQWLSPGCLFRTCREAPDWFTVSKKLQKLNWRDGSDVSVYFLPDIWFKMNIKTSTRSFYHNNPAALRHWHDMTKPWYDTSFYPHAQNMAASSGDVTAVSVVEGSAGSDRVGAPGEKVSLK